MKGEKFNIKDRKTGKKMTATKESGLWWIDGNPQYDLLSERTFQKQYEIVSAVR